MTFLKKSLMWAVVTPVFSYYSVHMYNMRHSAIGKKAVYTKSVWEENISEEEKELFSQRRQPIVTALRNFFEMKPQNVNSVLPLFADDVLYEDPTMRCVNRKELFDCFSLIPIVVKTSTTTGFEVVHSQDCIHIAYNRDIVAHPNEKITYKRSSMLVIKLVSEEDQEKVSSITDEWNDIPLLDPNNNPIMGKLFVVYRRFGLKYALFCFTLKRSLLNPFSKEQSTSSV